VDVGIGLNGMAAFDMVNEIRSDNWGVRLFIIPIPKINSRIYIEGCGMSLVVYSRKFPETETHLNIGTSLGLEME
jgi:hypothetical protein